MKIEYESKYIDLIDDEYRMIVNYEEATITCKFCNSTELVKNGHRKGTQYWICKECGKGFVANKALPKMKYPMDIIADATYNYYAGNSLNKVSHGIEQRINVLPSTSSVYYWIKRLTNTGINEAEKYTPEVGKKWVMDETVISLNGKKFWYIVAIDSDTRFILGTKVSSNRNKKDIQSVLEEATKRTKTIPGVVLSDGWKGYEDAIEQAYGSDSYHIISQPFTDKELSTNLIERWNGTLKDRLKTMRGMDRNEDIQMLLDGFVFHYNYLREHSSLGKTPAQQAKIKFPFKNWLDIVKSESPTNSPDKLLVDYEEINNMTVRKLKPYRRRKKIKSKKVKILSNVISMKQIR